MQELYRLIEGELIYNDRRDKFQFGFVYDDNGKLQVEIYFLEEESSILSDIWFITEEEFYTKHLSIHAQTEKGHWVTALNLFPVSYNKGKAIKGKFVCKHKLIYETPSFIKEEVSQNDKIFFIEIEGLLLEHTERTEQELHRGNSYRPEELKIEDSHWDHTTFGINLLTGRSFLSYFGELYNHPNKENKNQILVFKDFITREVYDKNEEYLFALLSLINGADVKVRKIFTGKTYNVSVQPESQVTETYSFSKTNNAYPSDYIPLNGRFGGQVLMKFFLRYGSFVEEYNKLDFKSVIFYLNRANENNNLEQKVFTLLIALEELGSKYRSEFQPNDSTIIAADTFNPIKEALKTTLNEFKNSIPNANGEYNDLLSRLCNINKRIGTEEKFYNLFQHAGIVRTPEINQLVSQRHFAIHEGNIGQSIDEKWNLFYRLDHLLRDVLLNRIGYDGIRNRRAS